MINSLDRIVRESIGKKLQEESILRSVFVQMLDHPQHVPAAFLEAVIHLVHNRAYEMRAQPAGPDLIDFARTYVLDVDGGAAIPQDKFQSLLVALAENVNRLALIALIGMLDNIGAGFIHRKHDLPSLPSRALHQLAQLAYRRTHDNEKPGVGGDSDFDHYSDCSECLA